MIANISFFTDKEPDNKQLKKIIWRRIISIPFFLLAFLLIGIELKNPELKWEISYNVFIKIHSFKTFFELLLFFCGILLVLPYHLINVFFYDLRDYCENKSQQEMILKHRLRATLFNNISIVIIFFILTIVVLGFYYFVSDYKELSSNNNFFIDSKRLGAIVIVVFLLQVLFRIFRFLIRIAAQYNCKADALEYQLINPECKLETLKNFFCDDLTDMKEEIKSSFYNKISDLFKIK